VINETSVRSAKKSEAGHVYSSNFLARKTPAMNQRSLDARNERVWEYSEKLVGHEA
jgi:hypothetical protein